MECKRYIYILGCYTIIFYFKCKHIHGFHKKIINFQNVTEIISPLGCKDIEFGIS